jgi:tRNA U34 2-thiouridine synthase MnmA/TrmU
VQIANTLPEVLRRLRPDTIWAFPFGAKYWLWIMAQKAKIKAIGMLSGGLDSRLAVKLMQEQGIEVIALHLYTGFCIANRNRRVGRIEKPSARHEALDAGADLDVPVEVIDIAEEYMSVVLNPRYGYGSGMNPCLDCRIFMLRRARIYMEQMGAHFVFTGEVVGQRPKSQNRHQLSTVGRESGLDRLLLRPLSAKLLPPTIPEERGWVDRDQLLAISGRSRKEQIAVAEELKIGDFPQPSGGCCLLPDPNFARRLRDFLEHYPQEAVTPEQMALLAVGRHFRVDEDVKVVVGRDEGENNYLELATLNHWQFRTADHPGPIALTADALLSNHLAQIAALVASYSDGKHEAQVRVRVQHDGGVQMLTVRPLSRDTANEWRI